ncbi:glycosyltransferase family 2 protein [Micromonospora chokoriensis]|uniref:Glycosyltransferase involved in cell wall bisynthesis n=1 Tax=Micromonospora chokoriensis TaxID=356851 RepID=A0A1C4YZJ9_9ACTN|nr:glycosyltransferase [Micromonospora chokoriensis]SCF26212.1 Glycosyltransferase involved in cell wall bisynthesis [Micromonospora chokoriensis]
MVNEPTHAPLLSIVVPVYGVEAYLYQCLESIRADIPAGESDAVEMIAVDDASPDGCGDMLRSYAAGRDGVRVVHLSSNVGLGLARNAGLDVATGRYVWFVDSDDWLPPGTIAAVLDRLRHHQPDVLMLDHLRVHEDGRREVDASSPLLRGIPGVTRLDDQPHLLRVQHTAWNKVVRRDFLDQLELRFFPGWYEDIPFSHPLLIGAEKISVLDRVCYLYRQGRYGAITSTRSGRHFDAFAQYERLLDWVARKHPDERLQAELFQLMINHYLVVVGNDGRLHPHLRRDFFHRAAEHYRRYLPAGGYPLPSGVTGLKHRLVGRDDWLAYSALRQAHRVAGRLRRTGPTGGVDAGSGSVTADDDAGRGAGTATTGDGELVTTAQRRDALAGSRRP